MKLTKFFLPIVFLLIKTISAVGTLVLSLLTLLIKGIIALGSSLIWVFDLIIAGYNRLISFCVHFYRASKKYTSDKSIIIGSRITAFVKRIKKIKITIPVVHPIHLERYHIVIATGAGVILALVILGGVQIHAFVAQTPNPQTLSDFSMPASTLIYDRNGTLLYSSYDNINRIPVPLSQVPVFLQNAIIAAEDKRFYSHWGIDPLSIVQASWYNLTHEQTHGASTITQQLAKNVFLSEERTLVRKLQEALIALRIERNFTKHEILELYFNTVSFGGNTSGVEAASQRYFGKHASELNKKESIFMATLPVGPSYLSANQKLQKERVVYVIEGMIDANTIGAAEGKKLQETTISLNPPLVYKRAPHFVDYVLQEIEKRFDKPTIEKGLIVHTTLDLDLQNQAQKSILDYVSNQQYNNIHNAAALVADPRNGDILAMVGSGNYYDNNGGQYNVVLSPRQLGSAVKLITYSLALETTYTPDTIIQDAPVTFREYPEYRPRNYDGKFHGNVTLRSAFANSYNIPALKVGYQLGIDNVAAMGYKMGIEELNPETSDYTLAMVLGGKEISLFNLTQAYGVVANNGQRVPFNPFLLVTNHQGYTVYKKTIEEIPVLSSKTAQSIYDILSDGGARAPAFGRSYQFEFQGRKVGIKTGTSNDNVDNTAFAFMPSMVVGTWMGNNDNTPMYNIASGYVGASAIMHSITQQALQKQQSTISMQSQ